MNKQLSRFLKVIGVLIVVTSLAFSLLTFLVVHTDHVAHGQHLHNITRDAHFTREHSHNCATCPTCPTTPNSGAPAKLDSSSAQECPPVDCPQASQAGAAAAAGGSDSAYRVGLQQLRAPPRGLRVHVYDLPGPWEADLLKNFKECTTYQWAAETRLPQMFRGLQQQQPPDGEPPDFYLVPFPSKCYFNNIAGKDRSKLNATFKELLQHIRKKHPFWDKSGGRDHIFIFPSGIGASMFPDWHKYIKDSIFLVAEGDRAADYVNTWKDIIIPGVSKSEVSKTRVRDWAPVKGRKLFVYFRGKFYHKDTDPKGVVTNVPLKVRNELARVLKASGRRDVKFTDEYANEQYIAEMRSSLFCVCPRGGTPWTRRVFDSIFTGCIPVVVSDDIEFPFEDFIPWDAFTIKIKESDAMKEGYLLDFLSQIPTDALEKKLQVMKEVRPAIVYGDNGYAFNAILWQLARKLRPFKHGSVRSWA